VNPRVWRLLDRQGSFDKAVGTKLLAHSRLCVSNGSVGMDGPARAGGDAGADEPENGMQASMPNASRAKSVPMSRNTAASLNQGAPQPRVPEHTAKPPLRRTHELS
jgi:hypothetical protein